MATKAKAASSAKRAKPAPKSITKDARIGQLNAQVQWLREQNAKLRQEKRYALECLQAIIDESMEVVQRLTDRRPPALQKERSKA